MEAEIVYLKDDMVTHSQIKKFTNENLLNCDAIIQRHISTQLNQLELYKT